MSALPVLLAAALAATPVPPASEPAGSPGVEAAPAAPGPTLAEASLPETVRLEDVLRLLREASPVTVATKSHLAEAEADVTAARVLPNPSFDYSGSHLTSGTNTGSSTENDYSLELPLLAFGQRRGRVRAAESALRLREGQIREELEGREREARDLFVTLLARQEKVRVLEAAGDDLARITRVIEGRMEAGDRSRYDAVRIRVEAQANAVDLAESRADADDAAGRLATLVGLPGWRPRAEGALDPDPGLDPSDEPALWALAQSRASLETARRAQAAAQDAVASARRERLPVPVLSGGYADGVNADSHSALFGLSVPLPIADRGQGAIARATATERSAERELDSANATARAELHRAVTLLQSRRAALETFEKEVLSRLEDVRRMAEASYSEGESPILDLLDVVRSLTGARLSFVDDLEAAKLAENDLLFATGRIGPGA